MKAVDDIVSNEEVIERLKDIISLKMGNKMIFDKDVASFIGISNLTLATLKRRNSHTLYKIILKLCARTGLNPMKLLF